MSIAGATDWAQDRGVHAAPNAFPARTSPSPLGFNDNLDRLFRWRGVLRNLGIPFDAAADAARRAEATGTTLQIELVASSLVRERDLYREIAAETGLRFEEAVDPRRIALGGADPVALLGSRSRAGLLKYEAKTGESCFLVAPEQVEFAEFQALIERFAKSRRRIRIATPSTMREALLERARSRLISLGRDNLFLRFPELSARIVANSWQGVMLGGAVVALAVAGIVWPWRMLLAAHICFSFFFLACVALRTAAAVSARKRRPPAPPTSTAMPHLSVLVALRNETDVIPDLLVALGRLVWPRGKLEIKLVCERDDAATLAAIRTQQLRPWIEVIEVPDGMPKTKPNALSYALPLTRGEIISLFDAEDRPHPLQLVEAWRSLAAEGPALACVQAPLDIDNAGDGILPHAFQVEYAALFHGLLPWLSRNGLMFPLGGTSNHFRRAALEHVLAWDPYNVTEDADLGVRLARFGYRTATITLPTREDAPDTAMVWVRQRTRWFKGWAQTWLVHMREPRRLLHDLGPGSFALVQVLFAGMLVSALFHPMMLVTGLGLATRYAFAGEIGLLQQVLFVVDAVNITLGYGSFLLLGWRSLAAERRGGFWKPALFLPIYWLMMTVAAWRAVWQLWRRPHLWEKTPHKRHRPSPKRPSLRRTALPEQR